MRGRALLLVLLIVTSLWASAVVLAGGPAAAQSDVPRGMVGVPSSNINENVPDHARGEIGLTASDLEGSVMTSRHAESLNVEITTAAKERGEAWLCNAPGATPAFCESPKLTIRLTDEQNHDGRHVALPKEALAADLGYVPEVAYIEHSSGETYTEPLSTKGDLVVLNVEEFSTNDVTFSGEVTINGNPATDGAQYQYNVSDKQSVGNYTIEVTGSTASQWSNESASGFYAGSSSSISVGGNLDPIGPSANGKPVLEVTGHAESAVPYNATSGVYNFAWGYDGALMSSEYRIPDAPSVINRIEVPIDNTDDDYSSAGTVIDVYIQEGGPDANPGNGQLVLSGYQPTAAQREIEVIEGFTYEPTSDDVTVEFVTTDSAMASNYERVRSNVDDGNAWAVDMAYDDQYGIRKYPGRVEAIGTPSGITADADDGSASTSLGNFSDGETKTAEFGVSESATAINWGGAGLLDYQLKLEERTQTVDPVVEVNGNTTSYTGSLADGETVSLATDSAWVQEDENRVNVSVNSPTSGPTGQTGLDYSHDAQDVQTVDFEGETWSERYNITHKYAEDRANATLTIPFASDRVIAIRGAEYRVNGGSWQPISESERSWDGSELTLQLTDMQAGNELQVRANGSKVKVPTGDITVLQPTLEGDKLQTEVELTSWSEDAYIEVGGTASGHYLHHAENESWQSPAEYAVIDAADEQKVYMPGASSGATARIETIPLDVDTGGDVEVGVKSAGFEPELKVRSSSTAGDSVTWTWAHQDLTTGTEYILYSLSGDKLIDSDEAQSPVTFESDDASQTLQIQEENSTSTSSSDGSSDGPIGGPVRAQAQSALNSVPAVLFAWFLIVAGSFVVSRRLESKSGIGIPFTGRSIPLPGGRIAWVGAVGSGIFILEFLGGGQISGGIASAIETLAGGLEQIVPFAGIVAVIIVGWYAYKRFIKGQDTTVVVRGE